jgi:pimeloyl-ACP methyl ester carboxylesterase
VVGSLIRPDLLVWSCCVLLPPDMMINLWASGCGLQRQEVIMTSAVTLVLVHGAWHGPWCWPLLMEQLTGVEVRAVPLSSSGNDPSKLGDLYEDAEIVRSAVGDVEGLVVVCAHSYGGAPVTEVLVGMRKVGRLVYLCAWQLDVGESLLCARQVVPPPWWDVHVV